MRRMRGAPGGRWGTAGVVLWAILVAGGTGCGEDDRVAPPAGGVRAACPGRCVDVWPGDNDQETLQLALLDARPGDVIRLRAGTYRLTGQLSLDVDDVTIRGEGMDRTILSFRGQTTGAEGLLVTANGFVIEDLALEDSPGDLLKVLGAEGVTIRRVRAEWTNGPATTNGAYGFYPIQSRNVLIEESVARGASDAGIYVGQCHQVIVRRNLAEYNVAGIEIENSTDADVYENVATRNTGGILVFNLPGLPFVDGRRTRVFRNRIVENNTPNFAARGTTVSAVPTGTGLMILANDEVEVFDNDFADNGTTHVLLIGWKTAMLIGGFRTNDRSYDQYSETLYFRGNRYAGGGAAPDPVAGGIIAPIVGGLPLPHIVYDGYEDPRKMVNGRLPERLRLCIDEPAATLVDIDLPAAGAAPSTDPERFRCTHPRLPAVVIPGVGEAAPPPQPFPARAGRPTPTPAAGSAETRCEVRPGAGVNFSVDDPPCELLSSYRFFTGDPARQLPNDRVVPYDLNTQLFSDYTHKHRFVWVPPGTQVRYDPVESFEFPAGTVIIKTFTYPVDQRDLGRGETVLETRLLVRRRHGWVGLPYVWNAERTDARLRPLGQALTVGGIQADGAYATYPYFVPNANQCKGCHNEHDNRMGPLGPKARNLNKPYAYPHGVENQLAYWTRIGLLAGAPDPAAAPYVPPFDDPQAGSLEARARAYLDVNCGNCHNPRGPGRTSGLYLTVHETDPLRLGICKSPAAAGRGTGGFLFDIAPGRPDESILVFRMVSTEPGIAMPELGRQRVHTQGVDVVREWIASLEGDCRRP